MMMALGVLAGLEYEGEDGIPLRERLSDGGLEYVRRAQFFSVGSSEPSLRKPEA